MLLVLSAGKTETQDGRTPIVDFRLLMWAFAPAPALHFNNQESPIINRQSIRRRKT